MKKWIVILFFSGTALAQQPVRASKAFFDTLQSSHANLPVLVNDSLTVTGTVNGFTPRQGVRLSDTTKFVLKSDTASKDPGYATQTQLATKQNTIAGLNNGATLDTVEFATKFLKNADSTTVKNTLLNGTNTWANVQTFSSGIVATAAGPIVARRASAVPGNSTLIAYQMQNGSGSYVQIAGLYGVLKDSTTGGMEGELDFNVIHNNFGGVAMVIDTSRNVTIGATQGVTNGGNLFANQGTFGGTVNGFTLRQGSAFSDTSQIAKVRWDTTAFVTTGLRIALSRPGMTAAGYAIVNPRITSDATPNASDVQLTAWCKNDSVVVHRIASGTSGLKITIWSKIP